MPHRYSTVEATIEAISQGEIVIVVDAEDRENEGDFICAAEKITPEMVHFMLVHGKGMLCVPLLPSVCERLDLTPLVMGKNTAPLSTPLAIPVDHRSSKTGITAEERAKTIRSLVEPDARAEDFVRPGHVHPLIAKEGGVLRRAGHTEATVDLARMAGLEPAGVLIEILDDTGERASRDYLLDLAETHQLKITTIEDLIKFRRRIERLVERESELELETRYGLARLIAYSVKYEQQQPLVLIMGDLKKVSTPLVRLHASCLAADLLSFLDPKTDPPMETVLSMFQEEGAGVFVFLPQSGGDVETLKRKRQENSPHTVSKPSSNKGKDPKSDPRDYGIGIQILKDLGLKRVRLLTNHPKNTDDFIYGGFDLEVVDQIPML
ncbi:Riboflavin biosynthesis protein RibBA [Planctomycetales bacterium 10988]|nr:Riboflavin biosynthesis protein RibBA [Planctomycetales bacterium 10988]